MLINRRKNKYYVHVIEHYIIMKMNNKVSIIHNMDIVHKLLSKISQTKEE